MVGLISTQASILLKPEATPVPNLKYVDYLVATAGEAILLIIIKSISKNTKS